MTKSCTNERAKPQVAEVLINAGSFANIAYEATCHLLKLVLLVMREQKNLTNPAHPIGCQHAF